MNIDMTYPLPLNVPLSRPTDTLSPSEGEKARERGTFRGPMCEVLLWRILTPALGEKERSMPRWNLPTCFDQPGPANAEPLSWGRGKGEGEDTGLQLVAECATEAQRPAQLES